MRIEIEYRKRWERAGIAVILLLFLSPGQYIFSRICRIFFSKYPFC